MPAPSDQRTTPPLESLPTRQSRSQPRERLCKSSARRAFERATTLAHERSNQTSCLRATELITASLITNADSYPTWRPSQPSTSLHQTTPLLSARGVRK